MSLSLHLVHHAPQLDFHADIPPGVITALVGPSGSGKTSILRTIAGLLRLQHEEVAFEGEAWSDSARGLHVPTRARPIGLVSQSYSLFPHLSAQANVEASLTHLARPERSMRARHFLDLAHVAGLEQRYPHQLSGGQRQRVALARAIAREPKVLLLDEPFSAVDRSTRKRLYVELRRLHQRLGGTMLLVTHDLDEAAQLAAHLILLRHGKSLQSGPVTEVLTRPRSEEAARLLDIPNVFPARYALHPDAGPALQWGPHLLSLGRTLPCAEGSTVKFAVLPQNVLLASRDKPWGSHLENPLPAMVDEVLALGAEALVWVRPAGEPKLRLQIRLPERALRRHGLVRGAQVKVCLRAADLVTLES